MKALHIFMIIVFLATGASAARHGYGAFPMQAQHVAFMDMPCCPPADSTHQQQPDHDMLACHYCCVAILALLTIPDFQAQPYTVTPDGERPLVLASEYNSDLFRPPRSFG
jgi:hypothetical protein